MWSVPCRRGFCTAVAPAASSTARVQLRPPGTGASEEKVKKFCLHLDRTLERGEDVDLSVWGPAAVKTAVQGLSLGTKSMEFQVSWDGTGRPSGGHRSLRFEATSGLTWEEYLRTRKKNTQGLFVQPETKALQLARAIAKGLQASIDQPRAVRVHTFLDDEASVTILAKALASAPTVYPYHRLKCTANVVRPMEDPRSRVIVYVLGEALGEPPVRATGASFEAMPPGADAEADHLRRFNEAVQDRLHRGDEVSMESRGPDAVLHAVRSLCLLQGHAAAFRVHWSDYKRAVSPDGTSSSASTPSSSSSAAGTPRGTGGKGTASVLKIEALRGPTWEEFNATDFSKTGLLLASEKSPVQKLAWAAVAEVRRHGAVSVHCYSDNKDAVNVAMKALATVPRLTGGQRLVIIPSFGRVGQRKDPVIRFHARLDRLSPEDKQLPHEDEDDCDSWLHHWIVR
ncbi:unnamed protein product, partial [Polarella glacialis]